MHSAMKNVKRPKLDLSENWSFNPRRSISKYGSGDTHIHGVQIL